MLSFVPANLLIQFLSVVGFYQCLDSCWPSLCNMKFPRRLILHVNWGGSVYMRCSSCFIRLFYPFPHCQIPWISGQFWLPTGPYMLPMRPLGSPMDWNMMPWTLLWSLYITLCHSPGLEIGLGVQSMNPKQLSKAAPFAEIASAWICSAPGLRISLFLLGILWYLLT